MSETGGMNLLEIKRRIAPIVGRLLAERPADAAWPKVSETTREVAVALLSDEELTKAIYFEGLKRIVRRELQLRNRDRNAAVQAARKSAKTAFNRAPKGIA